MTREAAKKKLIAFGIEEPTEEQVTKYLDSLTEEVKSEKAKADNLKKENERLKEEAGRAEELQGKIDEIEQGKLTEMEKLQKELEKSNNQIAELQKAAFIREQKASVALKFNVSSEQAEKIVKDDGAIDLDILGQIISEKETAAALAKEQEIAKNSTNPGGQPGKNSDDGTPEDVKVAESVSFGSKASEQTSKDYYLLH